MEKINFEEFECPICIEKIKKPIKILACGHSFCNRCITRHCHSNEQKR